MRLRTYQLNDSVRVAALHGETWRDTGATDLVALIADGAITDDLGRDGEVVDFTSAQVRLLPPIPKPGKILCVGLNYHDHAAESPYKEVPDYPSFFPRFASSLIADGDPIVRPDISHELDFEGEMAVIIGTGGRHIPLAEAERHVAGYALFNDGSIRNFQFLSSQWTPGKNFDDTGAFGPDFVTADELPAGGRGLELTVRLNGELMQQANTRDMVFDVATIIHHASQWATLEPGDVIVSGTPAGVGFARDPQVFMKAGDVVEVSIEKIGTLRNHVINES